MSRFRLLAALLLATATAASSQAQGTGRITGTVTDSAAARGLPNAQVRVVGTRLGAQTDDEGRFTITGVAAGTYTVEARRLGYRPASARNVVVTEGATATANLTMTAAPLTLEAVVTTGVVDPTAGTRVPFTVARVEAANAPVPAANALETIQGKVAGVTIIPAGQPGSGTNILLRTPTSINKSNSPLIVVDGVIQSSSFNASSADLESMNIESVEIVKGAAAASLYGSRAQAGVIQIRTKRGSEESAGPTRVTARSELGWNSLNRKIDWAQHHYYRTNESGQYVDEAGTVVTRNNRVPRPVYERFQDVTYADRIYDQVERFFDPGEFMKNAITVSQNAGRTNWFLSFVNTQEDGVVLNSGAFTQNDLRLNLDHSLRDNLQLRFSGYHSRTERQELYGDTFFDLINQAPDVDLRVPDEDGTPFAYQLDPEGREENPLYVLSTEESTRKRNRTQGSIDGRFTPFSWLTFDGNISYDRSDRRNDFFLDIGKKTEGFPLGGLGEISQFTGTTDAINGAFGLSLLGSRGPLTLRSTARAIMERETNQTTTASGEVLSAPGVKSLDNAQQQFTTSLLEEIRANGYFVTLGADYDGRFILDGLVRRDGSSLFGPEEKWNTYYRVSGAWRLAHESWWPLQAFTEFKVRASQGTAGGRPDFSDQFETFNLIEGGGVVKQNLGNRFLKPEHSTETEVGIDAIVKDRYSVQLSYIRNKVIDQLIELPLAGLYGYESQWQNAGTVTGNTFEATLEADIVRRRDFRWRMGLVADRSRHEITEFEAPCFQRNTVQFICANESLGSMYGFRFIRSAGELPTGAQGNASEFQVNDEGLLVWVGQGNSFRDGEAKQLWGTTSPVIGSATYQWGMPIPLKDAGGSNAVVKIGDGNPDFRFGFSNTIGWKNWSLFSLFDVQRGGNIYNQTNQRMYQWGRSADVDQNGKTQDLKKPVEYYISLYAANDPTDYFVEDASYVKLRELSLRYQLSGRALGLLSRVGASGAAFSVIGRNLLTFTDYKGYDPDVGGAIVRFDSFDYPRYRTITGSFEISF
jgi:TonB-linked SusC/RagA family outer membrane protein